MAATTMAPRARVRLTLDLAPALDAELEALAQAIGGTKADVFKTVIALLTVAVEVKRAGAAFGIAKPGEDLAKEVVGF